MSEVFFEIVDQVTAINFFGIPIPIQKTLYQPNHYLAIDHDGDLHVYLDVPKLFSTFWNSSNNGASERIFDLNLLDYLPSLEDWFQSIWDKEYWEITDFPLWSTP